MTERRRYFVYILASAKHGTLYIAMSGNLLPRVQEHREGPVLGFTKTDNVKLLVYIEECANAPAAYLPERQIK